MFTFTHRLAPCSPPDLHSTAGQNQQELVSLYAVALAEPMLSIP